MSSKYSKIINSGLAFYNGIMLSILGIMAMIFLTYKSIAPIFENKDVWWAGIGLAALSGIIVGGLGFLLIRIGIEQSK